MFDIFVMQTQYLFVIWFSSEDCIDPSFSLIYLCHLYRVWDTRRWSPERWCARGHRVVAACWGPKDILLFAAKGEPMVFALTNTGLMSGEFTSAQS